MTSIYGNRKKTRLGPLAGRIMISAAFLALGFGLITHMADTELIFKTIRMPWPRFFCVFETIACFAGAPLLLFSLTTRLACVILCLALLPVAVFMAATPHYRLCSLLCLSSMGGLIIAFSGTGPDKNTGISPL